MKNYIKLMRIKHWIKNFFIFIPLFFSKNLFDINMLISSIRVFFLFSLGSSLIYIINDMTDIEKDRAHPRKCKRPLASGEVSLKEAFLLIGFILIVFIGLGIYTNIYSVFVVSLYVVMNLAYSFGLKNKPILDVLIIAMGFIFRIMSGALAIGVFISSWLILTVFSLSMFLGFGKRRNEIVMVTEENRRKVLRFYSVSILENFINIFAGMFLIFYSLYCFDTVVNYFYLTLPLVTYGILKYMLLIREINNEGDPTEILLNDMGIKIVLLTYILIAFCLLYIKI